MNDVPGPPPVSVGKGIGAPSPEPIERLESEAESQQAFDGALDDSANLNESQAPQTRRAIAGSLDRLPGRQDDRETLQDGPALEPSGRQDTQESLRDEPALEPPGRPGAGGRAPAPNPEEPVSSSPVAGAENPVQTDKPARSSGEALAGSGGAVGRMHGASVPGTDFGRAVAGDAGTPAPGSWRNDDPACAIAPNRPRSGDAGPLARESSAGPSRGDASATERPGEWRAPGKQDATAPPRAEDPPRYAHRRVDPRAEVQGLSGAPGLRPTETRPRQPGQGQAVDPSGTGSAESARAPDQTETGGPREGGADDLGYREAPPADLTGLAAPAGVPEPGRNDSPDTVQAPVSRPAELAEQVADRILVSVPEPGSSGEVRISLKESVLDGSDVRVFRERGELTIVFLPRTEAAGQFLADNGTVLQQTLGERLQDERVRVEVEPPDPGGTGQQDNEGRSRQRYVSPDDPRGTG